MIEKDLWKKIQRGLGEVIDGVGGRMDRVENGVCDGMPDVSMTAGGIDAWVELKYVAKWPSRANTRVMGDAGLRPEQINWHLRHQRAGGRSFVVVGVGKEIYLADGMHAKEMNSWVSDDWFKKGHKVEGWMDLYKKLFTRYL
jgi:hypothetical protein